MQTVLINEHRLSSFEPKAKALIESEREKFLFGTDFQTCQVWCRKNEFAGGEEDRVK
jgi:Fe-S cluster biosynthesis and repair protein YggX